MSTNGDDNAATLVSEAMACGRCGWVLCGPADVLLARAEGPERDAVYTHELDDVCGHKKVWTYSETNPDERRFDVIRLRPDVARRGAISLGGVWPTAEHSWFPPFAWNMASCVRCSHHVGWGFYDEAALPPRPSEESESDSKAEAAAAACSPVFVGLILTNCTALHAEEGKPLTVPGSAECRRVRDDVREYMSVKRDIIAALRAAPRDPEANRLAKSLFQLEAAPEKRQPSVVAQLRAAVLALPQPADMAQAEHGGGGGA